MKSDERYKQICTIWFIWPTVSRQRIRKQWSRKVDKSVDSDTESTS